MKAFKRILAMILIMGLVITMGTGMDFAVFAAGETELITLRVNDEVSPLGLDDATPQFSWKMKSDVIGQKQNAYRVTVAKDSIFSAPVWDSGKVNDGVSLAVEYTGEALTSSTKYFWKVTVWDKNDNEVNSAVESFEMGLLMQSEWNASKWISAGKPSAVPVEDNFKYTAEADFTVENSAIGLIFNYVDAGNFYMWQINSDHESPGRIVLRPHSRKNGNWTVSSTQPDITDLCGGVQAFKTQSARLKVEVTKTEIKAYVNGTLVSTITHASLSGIGPYLGSVGVRSIGSHEIGTLDNLKLTNYTDSAAGEVVCDYDFTDYNPLGKGEMKADGTLYVNNIGEVVASGDSPESIPSFRKEFCTAAGGTIDTARLYVSGLGVFDAYINGERVGEKQTDGTYEYDELKPGFTQIGEWENEAAVTNTRVHYYTYDVKDYLNNAANNAISANVSSGWWTGDIGGSPGDEVALRVQLLIKYTDGSSEIIVTDTSWKSSTKASPYLLADIWTGETYRAEVETPWKAVGFDDSAWENAVVNTEFDGDINSVQDGAKVRIRKDLELSTKTATVYEGATGADDKKFGTINAKDTYQANESFTLTPGQTAVIDLGQNFSGWPEIKVEGAKNTEVIMRHGEMLNDNEGIKTRGNDGPEGSVYRNNLAGADATAKYFLKGEGIETYHATYTFFGFRYMDIIATAPITIHGVKGIVVTSVGDETGLLETSNDSVNRLISNIKWGQYSNFLSIPTDCPQRRERQGWTADTHVFSTTASYLADSKQFLSKWMIDMRDAQWPDGNYPEVAPKGCFRNPGAAAWSEGGVIVPYNLYKMYGDISVLEDNYDSMQMYMDVFMASMGRDGNRPVWGDWLSPGVNDDEMKKFCAVSYYAWSMSLMAEMAEILGKTADVTKYSNLFATQKAYWQQLYMNTDGRLKRTDQTYCLLALKIDLLPNEASRQKAKEALLENIRINGDRLQTGFIGTATIMQTLSEIGASDTAYKLLLQRNDPSWLYSVDQGATTVWEYWDCYTKERGFSGSKGSFNHYSYGAVAEWMYSYMAGIMFDIESPGFKHFKLAPNPDQSVSAVDCTFDSPYGEIISNWKFEGEKFTYHAQVPANTTADIIVPVEDGKTLTVNGKQLSTLSLSRDGIRFVRNEDGNAIFRAVAGSFDFATTVTAYSYITFTKSGETPVYALDCLVKINGGELQEMPNMLRCDYGDEMSIEVFIQNDVDYKFNSWSGDITSKSNLINFTVNGNMTLNANFKWASSENLAIGAAVTASSFIAGAQDWAPDKLTDGVLQPSSGSNGYSSDGLGSTTPSTKPTIELDLGGVKEFNRIQLYPRTGVYSSDGTSCNFPLEFTIEVRSNTSDAWTLVETCNTTAPYRKPLAVDLDQAYSARYIKITVNKVSMHASDESNYRIQLCEIGVYNYKQRTELTSDIYDIRDDGYIAKVKSGMNLQGFTDGFETKGEINVKTKGGAAITAGDIIGTEMVLEHMPGDGTVETFTIAVLGDMDGNAQVNLADIVKMRNVIMDSAAVSTLDMATGDLDFNSTINLADIVSLRNIIMGVTA